MGNKDHNQIEEMTKKVREFYEQHPYPSLGDKLNLDEIKRIYGPITDSGKILDAGCGTGFGVVSLASLKPEFEYYGFDLSEPSLAIARQLAQKHNVQVEFKQGSYLNPLPWSFKFKYILMFGTLHHSADPARALINLTHHLDDDGMIYINLYGKKYHRRKFEIIEMLDILQQEGSDDAERFKIYQALMKEFDSPNFWESIIDLSPRRVVRFIRSAMEKIKSSITSQGRSVPYHARFNTLNQLWLDSYCHPNEYVYDIWDFQNLLESANLEVVEMLSLGRIDLDDLPELWRPLIQRLPRFKQYRIMELYYPQQSESISAWVKPRK